MSAAPIRTNGTATGRLQQRAVNVANEAGARVLRSLEGWLMRQSVVPTTPFLPLDTFDWVPLVEAGWKDIRSELEGVLARREDLPNFQDISTDQASITSDDRWKTYFFMGYGFRSEPNCARCPRTAALLDSIPGVTTAFFSILSPGKEIGEHRGPWRGVLRYHLGLKVPEPADQAGIRVGGEEAHWTEGGSLLFDDGYTHEAWNRTEGTRVVLFVDVVRPLKPLGALANKALIAAISSSPFVRDAKSRHRAWERRFEALRPGSTR